jgi:hypothetical protein
MFMRLSARLPPACISQPLTSRSLRPKIPETPTRGQIRLHKALVWIHGPGMILTPVPGAMAFEQKSRGEKVHGIASAHGAVGVITAAAYGFAIVSVSIKF